MAVTPLEESTKTAEIGVEHFVSSPGTPGTYQFEVDLSNMAAGDVVRLRVYRKVIAGGTAAVPYEETFRGAQVDPIKLSVPFSNGRTEENATRCSITQTNGTGRAIPWTVNRFA